MSSLPEISPELSSRADAARLEHDPGLVDRLLAGIFVGDPMADRLVLAFDDRPGGEGLRLLDEALRDGVAPAAAPPELAEMLAPVFEPPSGVDMRMVEAGALAYWRTGGVNLGLALTCGSLAFGYQSARLSRPLAATGRLTRMAPRRLQETSAWLAIATRPGALQPGGAGIRATVRLRVVHALVRRHLAADPSWDEATWGVPISATDSALTAMGGFL